MPHVAKSPRSSAARARRQAPPNGLLPLALEPRIMFDGAAVADMADHAADTAADNRDATVEPAPSSVTERREVAFIDTGVAGYQSLLDGIAAGTEVVLITGGDSGLAQMAQWAESHSGYDAIHVFSHGADGVLVLGSDTIDAAALSQSGIQAGLAALGQALSTDGDLMLYGCDVAAGEVGRSFIANLAAATGADVAASDDATGRGGDWTLEERAGTVETASLASSAYAGTLSIDNVDIQIGGGSVWGVVAIGDGVEFFLDTYDNQSTTTLSNLYFDVNASTKRITLTLKNGYPFNDGVTGFDLVFSGTNLDKITSVTRSDDSTSTASVSAAATGNDKIITFTVVNQTSGNGVIVWDFNFSNTGPTGPTTTVSTASLSADTGSSSSDWITGTASQTVSGTLSANLGAGEKVEVSYDGGSTWSDATTYTQGSTAWSTTTTLAGANTFQARVTDTNGSSTAYSHTYTLDSSAPSAPSAPDMTAGTDSGTNTDNITSDTTPTFSGTAEANAIVKLYDTDGSTEIGSVTADGSGNWTITTSVLSAGAHTITAKATDTAGNQSAASTGLSVTIDTAAPAAPSTPDMTAGTDSGSSSTDNITSDTTPTFSGTAEANATVKLYDTDGTTEIGSATADGSGNWTITVSTLSAGAHTITAKATDVAGNQDVASGGLSVTIDTAAPAAPSAPDMSAGSDSGTNTDNITTTTTPTFTGTAEANATVTLYDTDGSTVLGTGTADGSGNWSITASTLSAGAHTLTAKATDAAGNQGVASTGLSVTIDTTAPAAPTALTISSDTGNSATDGITSDTTLTIGGSAEANASVEVFKDGVSIGTTTANGAGAWSFDYTGTTLTEGSYAFTAIATDVAGNVGTASTTKAVTVDTTAPAVPAVTAISSDTGVDGADAITTDTTLVISGTAAANITVEVFKDGVSIGTTTADGTGAWSFDHTGTTLALATHAFTAKAQDSAGNASAASTALNVQVVAGPAAPTGLAISTDSGSSNSDGKTTDTTLILTGSAPANATVLVYRDGVSIGTTTADGTGAWTYDYTGTTLAEGTYAFTAVSRLLGQDSAASTAKTVVVDTTAPAAPSALTISSDTGNSATDGITSDTTLTIGGSAEANASVEVFKDGVSIGTATADGTGAWSFDYTGTTLAEGSYAFTAIATDVAGNVGTASTAKAVTVDTTAPAVPAVTAISTDTGTSGSDAITTDQTLVISGTATANITVEVFKDGASIGTTTADGTGAWSFDHTGTTLALATYAFTAKAQDSAGNASAASTALSVQVVVAPAAPTGLAISTDSSGSSNSDGITSDTTLIVSGTAPLNATVTIYKDGVSIGTATADGTTGAWSFDHTGTTLAAGAHVFTAKATLNGQDSAVSSALNVTVDTTAPSAPAVTAISSDTGSSHSDGITIDTGLTISGTAEANATVEVFKDGVSIGTTTADGAGAWSFDHSGTTLALGNYAFTAKAKDAAGNESAASTSLSVRVTIDDTAPGAPSLAATGGTSTTVPVTGTAEAEATVKIYDGATLLGTVTVDEDGNWTYTATLAVGSHTLTATATDAAGNVSVASAPATVTITAVVGSPSNDTGSGRNENGDDTAPKPGPIIDTTPVAPLVTIVRDTGTGTGGFGADAGGNLGGGLGGGLGGATTGTGTGAITSVVGDGLTRPGGNSFQVALAGRSAGGGDALVINAPMRDAIVAEGTRISVTIPADTFAHTKADAVVSLTATRANGAALPGWMAFNPSTGTFEGTPPPGFRGEVVVRVIARDNDGRQVVQTFKIVVGQGQGNAAPAEGGQGGGGRDGGQGEGQGQGGPQAPGRTGDASPFGRPGLTAQLRALGQDGQATKQAVLFNALKTSGKAA
ncbi:Ig-like domain-containing protein [Magnetospirillum gryphiswaldense]|uniref:Dystroglycan-type cadherin-like domain-containing protein n=1 Tax=Magnetospirillum gryphiswaldense TaxID=55518 RepID=A4TXJ1_9PROT|nr:Ig-like domain-containing protein [Magnetospirillum gryphiswaldense]AVM75442.1 Exoglucanase B precursor [Magnetospirillum gryphiswaldense MSR-1]AVM79345.1 Exoglucanase B precursor [Magnetospirillum gryphiswaldense]CAM75348.1 conserved hypothetical protein [Magnetospirillum gryphiswaldense MSR-1]